MSAWLPWPLQKIARFDDLADLLDGFPMQRAGAADGFESVELAGIVAAGDHHGAIGFQMHRRKIQQRRRHHADIGDLAAGIDQAFEQRVAQARRAQPAVAAQSDGAAALALQ